MFDALQLLQSTERTESQKALQKNVPAYSYLVNMKTLKHADF